MLFGRKTPPAAPKADSPTPPQPGARPFTAGEAGNSMSPLASLNAQPGGPMSGPPTGAHAPAAAAGIPAPSSMAPTMAQALSDAQPAYPAYPDMPSASKGPDMNSIPKPPSAPSVPGAGFKPDVPRRVVDLPGSAVRQPAAPIPSAGMQAAGMQAAGMQAAPVPAAPVQPAAHVPAMPEQRRLIVGRDISLSGEIGSCDVVVVEGTVEAKLRDGRSVEIAETGLFKGSVEIEEADIAGRFEGDIIVRGRLTVRATGKITGSIRFGELAVDAGGQLIGDIQLYSAAATAARPAAPAPVAAEPAPAPAAEAV
ncbi:polymer-forming cytoskeletal protein [Azospirillum picis]|uniref:Cytoskeletal protein CcmA (Bactofilin family) n=1 Tax=Azospirillum picis TaxID=488438 RepID=A0ABU0MKX9_9PROT|nr:polymer-forming cytoskeletal protein [Azospirillum picis]MBP2300324.1 cytoskeletal protein CcmA (bactofilin family) [Azospirillum picis]MDQ0534120.1 cytoskeletal protein CcmA (bactofilin family) [Azospirillum picis]